MDRPRPEQVIASMAARQQGVVTRSQLLRAGLASHLIEHRLATGQLTRLHRGVYRAGPVAGPRSCEIAATLACGTDAVLSHLSAARLWGLSPGASSATPIDVAVRAGYRRRSGLRVHRLPTLGAEDWTRLEGVPVTTAARTIWDLAGTSAGRDLERSLAAALDRGLVRTTQLRRLLDRHRGAPGSRRLRDLLEAGPVLTRSEAEERFLDLVRKAQLPEPRVNARLEGLEVDFLWSRRRLVVEVDGFAHHGSGASFEADRRRDGRLVAAGFAVIRVTWRQLTREPLAVVGSVARALGGGGRPAAGSTGRR